MKEISQKDINLLLSNVDDINNCRALIFSISLKEFEKQKIFFQDNDKELYTNGIESHIAKISKHRYLKLGENEYLFVVIQNDSLLDDIEKRILGELYGSIKIGDYSISIPYSIGSSTFPDDSSSFLDCITFARVSKLYHAEHSLKYYSKYHKKNYEDAWEEFMIKNTLLLAIEEDELDLVYQPVFSPDKKTILYFEALLRWKKDGIFINPQKIILISEQTEIIHILTEYVAEKVCIFQHTLKQKYGRVFPISVNISQSALANPKLPWKLSQLLQTYNLDFSEIKLEITETTSSKQYSSINKKKITPEDISQDLISRGFTLYADDFGVGFSNLEFLSKHHFSGIKLDKYFIDSITTSHSSYFLTLIKTLLDFATNNNQQIICEGVETKKQLELLKELGFNFYVQGYLFSKPVTRDEIEKKYYQNIN